jgi:hypothetical protein
MGFASTNPEPAKFMNTTTNASWIPEVIANESLGLLGSYLQLGATVAKDTDLTPVRYGQTISIPRRGTITALQKTENTATTVQKPTADDVQVTVDQHWYVKIAEEDFTRAMQPDSALPGYVEDAVIVLGEKIEAKLVSLFSQFSNIDAGGSDGDAYKGVVNVRQKMVENKVPRLAEKYGYISPRFAARLLKEEAVLDPKVIQNQAIRESGVIGRTAGFNLWEGQLTPTSGSPAWDQNFFYAKNALVLASRPLIVPDANLGVQATVVQSDAGLALRLVRYYDPENMGVVVQLDVLFGAGVNDSRQGYVLESQ